MQGDGRSYSYLAGLSLAGAPDAHWEALFAVAKAIPGTVHQVNHRFLLGEPVDVAPSTITPTRLTPDVLAQLRAADHIVTQALVKHGLLRFSRSAR